MAQPVDGGPSDTAPSADGGQIRPQGALSGAEIAAVFRQHQRELAVCYKEELAARRNAEGKVTVLFTIEPDGSVTHVHLAGYPETTLWSKTIEGCLTNAIRTWRFPPPKGGGAATVIYPITLQVKR